MLRILEVIKNKKKGGKLLTVISPASSTIQDIKIKRFRLIATTHATLT
jgi:hypothetical protein